MRAVIYLAAALAVTASSALLQAKTAQATPFNIKGTTWVLRDKTGSKIRESVDPDGNYVANTLGGKHVDHGTAVMKGTKACFTSAMDKKGEVCWTTQPVKIGQVMRTTSDEGEKLKVTRVKYVPMKMPR
jgi:hypothetical protein